MLLERFVSFVGLIFLIFLAWALGGFKGNLSWRIIVGGVLLQFVVAISLLNGYVREPLFEATERLAEVIGKSSEAGADFLFGVNGFEPTEEDTPANTFSRGSLLKTFAFGVLPTVIFFSSLMSVLYYIGFMQLVVKLFSVVMQWTLGTTGAETLAASANIFLGQTEAPLVVKPYIARMSLSELNAVMIGGFGSTSGSLLIAYSSFGAEIGHLLIASFISAPASLVIAKLILPMPKGGEGAAEEDISDASRGPSLMPLNESSVAEPVNIIDAAAAGASDGLKMALNIGAMLIAFLALIYLGNWMLGAVTSFISGGKIVLTMQQAVGYLFAPFVFMLGVPWSEIIPAGELLGTKIIANEFVAYERMGQMLHAETPPITERTKMLMTYALCGFANLSAIGIQIGGISALAPQRRSDIASLGFKAMLGGMLACNMTACVVGILL
jgi:CNT family concentrative nucleoside transporter